MEYKIDDLITELVIIKRTELHKSVKEISNILNVSESYIRQIESYARHYNHRHLYVLANAFECSIEDFFPNECNYEKIIERNHINDYSKEDFNKIKREMVNQIVYGGKEND